MKKKSLAALLSGFLTVCLTGVGFASWIIVSGDKEEISGQVNVETVTPKSITLTPEWADNNEDGEENQESVVADNAVTTYGDDCFSFGPAHDSGVTTSYSWLKSSADTRGELLSLELNVTVNNAQLVNKTSGVKFKVDVVENATGGYDKALKAKYINEVTATLKDSTETKYIPTASGEAEASETFTIVISTTWGEYFDKEADTGTVSSTDNLNPFDYYNSYASTDKKSGDITYAADASTTLGNLYTYLSGVSFKLTIEAEA